MEENNTPVFDDGSVARALSRVRNTLNYSLKANYGIEDKETTEKFLKMHGLDSGRFDFLNNFEKLIETGIADESVDTNANKSDVSITGLLSETAMPINKIVGYRYLYRKMKEMYGKKEAKRLSGLMYDMSIALADSTNILKPYCYSINAQKLVFEGRPFGSLHSLPPKRVGSYIHSLCETIHQLSNHLAGAIAIGSFFLDIAYVMLFREGKTLEDLKAPIYRKYVENEMQSFVHSMNHLSRNSTESPFSNVSIFDRPKLKSLLDDDNLGWYYSLEPADELAMVPERAMEEASKLYNTEVSEENHEAWIDYVTDTILELEDIFMDVMDKGDVAHDNRPITFPVTTCNISRGKDEEGNYKFEDPDFVDHICQKHDVMRYNIYISEGNKVASCCRLINDSDLFELGGQVNSFGGTSLSLGSHRVATINLRRISLECDSFEDYKARLHKRMEDASSILLAHRALLKELIAKGTQPFISNGWLDLDRMFSTFGIMGYYEASKDLEKRFGGDVDYIGEIIAFIDKTSRELSKEKKNVFNVEEIPGETMSAKLANTDRWIYGEDLVPEPMYTNQFVPLWEETTLSEKFKEEGRLTAKLTGGGICHYSLGEKLTAKQYRYVIQKALESGLEHFALNPEYSCCKNDHYSFGHYDICPKCGAPIVDYLTRTVGFFVHTKDMTTTKREEDFEKRHYNGI